MIQRVCLSVNVYPLHLSSRGGCPWALRGTDTPPAGRVWAPGGPTSGTTRKASGATGATVEGGASRWWAHEPVVTAHECGWAGGPSGITYAVQSVRRDVGRLPPLAPVATADEWMGTGTRGEWGDGGDGGGWRWWAQTRRPAPQAHAGRAPLRLGGHTIDTGDHRLKTLVTTDYRHW